MSLRHCMIQAILYNRLIPTQQHHYTRINFWKQRIQVKSLDLVFRQDFDKRSLQNDQKIKQNLHPWTRHNVFLHNANPDDLLLEEQTRQLGNYYVQLEVPYRNQTKVPQTFYKILEDVLLL